MTAQLVRHLFTVDDYYRMAKAGILGEDDRVELIEGEIIEMAPIGSRHASTVKRLAALLTRALSADRATIGVQDPVRLGADSELLPDLALLRPRADFYATAHPVPADVLLLIEVSDTTLDYDREVKLPLYARASVPEVWLVDLAGRSIQVYSRPSGSSYESHLTATRGASLAPQAFPDLQLSLDAILG